MRTASSTSSRRSPSSRRATSPPWASTSSTGKSCASTSSGDEADPNSSKDFGKNIIPTMLADGQKLWPYRFKGYWRDVGTIVSLWDANMDMLSPDAHQPLRPRLAHPLQEPDQAAALRGAGQQDIPLHRHRGLRDRGPGRKQRLLQLRACGQGRQRSRTASSCPAPSSRTGPRWNTPSSARTQRSRAGAKVGTDPDGSESWNVATCGPGIEIGAGAVVKAGAMIYDSVPAGEGGGD